MSIRAETLIAKHDDVMSVSAHFARIVKPLRSLVVELRYPDRFFEIYRPLSQQTTTRQQLIEEKRDHKNRLHALADDISKKFKIPRKSCRVRYRMRGCQLFVPLWVGTATRSDIARLRKISEYVKRRAKKT